MCTPNMEKLEEMIEEAIEEKNSELETDFQLSESRGKRYKGTRKNKSTQNREEF